MKRFIAMALISAAGVLAAAEVPPGFVVWKNEQLHSYNRSMSAKAQADQMKVATTNLAHYTNHLIAVGHREGPGQSELHKTQTDFFIVEDGTAKLIVGGKMVNAKTTAPNELRGDGIQGGTTETVSAGDIVHIPANTPHQLIVQPGSKFTYVFIKVDK